MVVPLVVEVLTARAVEVAFLAVGLPVLLDAVALDAAMLAVLVLVTAVPVVVLAAVVEYVVRAVRALLPALVLAPCCATRWSQGGLMHVKAFEDGRATSTATAGPSCVSQSEQ